ncbi:nickel pincer cofactor biosynthesis protein LarB [bacterium]|jgi:pyridinium-3,5-biscarboxylic acid mononucleotide synthase|nr:nickel pincer cofactor biosynthesis protein LarB [bacterium]
MDRAKLESLLTDVREGRVSIDQAAGTLQAAPVLDLGFANIDQQRHLRCGFPEVIYSEGKTAEQVVHIMRKVAERETICLATRVSPAQATVLERELPDVQIDPVSRIAWLGEMPEVTGGIVRVVTAGTSDLPVAREAELTARALGCEVSLLADVGVAGLHRILARIPDLAQADAVVVVAGMEGALPSVVGGLVDCPVVAVPTSVGYGANFQGVSALLCMLTSCAANVTVVNIDAGFCGGFVAGLIARRARKR